MMSRKTRGELTIHTGIIATLITFGSSLVLGGVWLGTTSNKVDVLAERQNQIELSTADDHDLLVRMNERQQILQELLEEQNEKLDKLIKDKDDGVQ